MSLTTNISSIKKRDGSTVDFLPYKITNAVRGAFVEAIGEVDPRILDLVTECTIDNLRLYKKEEETPSVEDVQNAVEKTLMEQGFFDVAKAYIIYRYEHQKTRETATETPIAFAAT